MLLFRGEKHIDRWCNQWNQPRGAALSVNDAWKLAQSWYGNKLDPDWRRFTLEEAEEVLSSLGLRGSFWSLRAQ